MRPTSRYADPSSARIARSAVLCLAAVCAAFSGVMSCRAPLGTWENELFGQPVWSEDDPGAYYVDAAHRLAWGEAPVFVGHPGTPLVLLLSGLQHATYALVGGPESTFTGFVARHLPAVFVLSKLLMTALHLLTFALLFAFARRLLGDDLGAFFAVFGYATSLPVFYYLSRISVEPLAVALFLASVLAIWDVQDLAAAGRRGAAVALAGVAGAAAVSGSVTKLNFLGPLPFFLMALLLVGDRGEGAGRGIPRRTRVLALGAFAAVGVATACGYSRFIDWDRFAMLWSHLGSNSARSSWTADALLPGPTRGGAFLLCELPYVAAGAWGWIAFLRREPAHRVRVVWVSAYAGWGLALFAFRVATAHTFLFFHYFHLTNAVLAVFFGYFTIRLPELLRFRSISTRPDPPRALALGIAWVAAVHAIALVAVIESRRSDADAYGPNREIHDLIARLAPTQRLGLVPDPDTRAAESRQRLRRLHAMPDLRVFPKAPPGRAGHGVREEFESLFRRVPPSALDLAARTWAVPALGGRVVVLEERRRPSGPHAAVAP